MSHVSNSNSLRRQFFINPHTHHSYFSVLALSRLGPVEVLCPPLILQILLGHWKSKKLRLRFSLTGLLIAQPIAVSSFFLFAFRLINEATYIHIFRIAARILLMQKSNRQVIFVYQDYLLPLIESHQRQLQLVVSEFIIQSPPGQPNHISSIRAAHSADCVLIPTSSMQAELSPHTKVFQVPYGGDKSKYRSAGSRLISFNTDHYLHSVKEHNIKNLLVVARANTMRKGLDLLIDTLVKLDKQSIIHPQYRLEVAVCGSVDDPNLLDQLNSCRQIFNISGMIKLHWGQLRQDLYLDLLRQADLFVMPSRLESSSLAALEALWSGVPCLLSPECGIDAFIPGEHGLLVETSSAEPLDNALRSVLSQPCLLDAWRCKLQRDRQLFTWDAYLDRVAEAVASL